MEKYTSILIADLSGYTAVTEAHGAGTAADIIDQYLKIIEDSLAGDAHLHERVGDEVMIISSSPEYLTDTALMLLSNTHNTQNFLQLHGGLHYGPVLKRHNSYFGTAVNITARIANSAAPGTFLCSLDFYEKLPEDHQRFFKLKGKMNFKNISGEVEVLQLDPQAGITYHIDPVCKMLVDETAITHPTKSGLFFCSNSCLEVYLKNSSTMN